MINLRNNITKMNQNLTNFQVIEPYEPYCKRSHYRKSSMSDLTSTNNSISTLITKGSETTSNLVSNLIAN